MFNTVKEQRDLQTKQLVGYQADGMFIPLDEANSDYQKVKDYIADGGIVEPAFTLADEKQFKLQELEQAYEQAINADIQYMNTTFQADETSHSRMAKVLSTLSPFPKNFVWYDINNKPIKITKAGLTELSYNITKRQQKLFSKLQKLKALTRKAIGNKELDKVMW